MITKAVTQDIYGNTHVYRFKTYTYSEKVKVKCCKCGKTMYKTVSYTYQDSPDMQSIEEQKQKILSQEHICASCIKKSVKAENVNNISDCINESMKNIHDIQEQIVALRKQLNEPKRQIEERIKGKVLLFFFHLF